MTAAPTYSGVFASTPVADRETVYVQDLHSNVYALDRSNGTLRWAHRYRARTDGPNGLAVDGGRVYGGTDSDAFALASDTGRELWRRHLTSAREQFVDVAPVVWNGLVFVSTVGYSPFGRGAIYALDAATGAVRWKFVTIEKPWRYPLEAGGGGLWYPVSVDALGRLYAGNSNPTPWGGTPERPNGGAFPGPALYTDSLIVLDARTGDLLWYDQVTPHDVRDYDFQATPILATVDGADLVFGAGKAGRVIAWDRETRRRRWTAEVGLHRNDRRPTAAAPCDRVPRAARRRGDADGLRGRPAVRARRRSVRMGQCDLPAGTDDRRSVAGDRPARRSRRRDRSHAVGAAPALSELRLRNGVERRRLHVDVRRLGVCVRRPTTGRSSGTNGCGRA